MFFVYAIFNRDKDKIYIGQTENLEERITQHNLHLLPNTYTARYPGQWVVIYSESCITRKEALVREKQLKSYRGREFVRTHIPR